MIMPTRSLPELQNSNTYTVSEIMNIGDSHLRRDEKRTPKRRQENFEVAFKEACKKMEDADES